MSWVIYEFIPTALELSALSLNTVLYGNKLFVHTREYFENKLLTYTKHVLALILFSFTKLPS